MAKQYQVNDTAFICVAHEVYDFATDEWSLEDADENYPKITLIDADEVTVVDAATMDKVALGKYTYRHKIVSSGDYKPPSGQWTGFVQIMAGTYPSIQYFSFNVKE